MLGFWRVRCGVCHLYRQKVTEKQLAVDALGFEMVGLDQESFVQRGYVAGLRAIKNYTLNFLGDDMCPGKSYTLKLVCIARIRLLIR